MVLKINRHHPTHTLNHWIFCHCVTGSYCEILQHLPAFIFSDVPPELRLPLFPSLGISWGHYWVVVNSTRANYLYSSFTLIF